LEELAERPDRADFRYVLALLMIRRRILRLEETRRENGTEILRVYCPLTDVTYEIPAVVPSEERLQELEQELLSLLEGDERELALGPDSAHQSVGGSAS
jgi:hypothetical protein